MSHLRRAAVALALSAAILGVPLYLLGFDAGSAVVAALLGALAVVLGDSVGSRVDQPDLATRIEERQREFLAQRRGAAGPAADFEREADA